MSDDYTVHSADYLAGYAAGWAARDAEDDPPLPRCEVEGCERIPLLDPARRRCREHREGA